MCLILIFNKLFSFIATWSFFSKFHVRSCNESLALNFLTFLSSIYNFVFPVLCHCWRNRFSERKTCLICKERFSFEKVEKFQKIQISSFLFKTFQKMECYWHSYDTWKSLAIISSKRLKNKQRLKKAFRYPLKFSSNFLYNFRV